MPSYAPNTSQTVHATANLGGSDTREAGVTVTVGSSISKETGARLRAGTGLVCFTGAAGCRPGCCRSGGLPTWVLPVRRRTDPVP